MTIQHRSVAITLAGLFFTVATATAGDFYLVKEVNHLGEEDYKSMDKKQYIEEVRQIKEENMVWTQAQRLAEQEWSKMPHASRYPGRSLHHRQIKIYRHYRTAAEAESAAMKKAEMIRRALEKKEDRDREREYRKNRSRHRSSGSYGRGHYPNTSLGRKRQREAERQELLEEANTIFETQVQNLLEKKERIRAAHAAKMAAEAGGEPFARPPAE